MWVLFARVSSSSGQCHYYFLYTTSVYEGSLCPCLLKLWPIVFLCYACFTPWKPPALCPYYNKAARERFHASLDSNLLSLHFHITVFIIFALSQIISTNQTYIIFIVHAFARLVMLVLASLLVQEH